MSYSKTRSIQRNLSMLTDFYELTMANGYFENGFEDKIAYFDMFFRRVPDGGGFAIAAGLEQLIEYLNNLSFSNEDIEFLRSKGQFSEGFLDYLKNFEFKCDVWAVSEGTPIFPNEPVVKVRGPIIQAQFIETMLLLTINHQSLIATKTNRIVRAAGERAVIEFGSRRAHGSDAAIYGARAAFIGGAAATSCTIAEQLFGIPAVGTMAHSWVQLFDDEIESFRSYARAYPQNCLLLVDTYNVLKSGVPNAIKIFNEEIVPRGFRPSGIRIDSGDLAYLSKEARKMLDHAGFEDCRIIISSSLDENIIRDLLIQGAPIDSFGVGERLITSKSDPVFGGVYKLSAVEKGGEVIPRIKVSNNVEKITNPGSKNLFRLYSNGSQNAIADIITLFEESIDSSVPYSLFDPLFPWKKSTIRNFTAVPLLKRIFENGRLVYDSPSVDAIKEYSNDQISKLWPEIKRFENPHRYYVNLSENLWNLKNSLIDKYSSI